jgi:hypothetical protein
MATTGKQNTLRLAFGVSHNNPKPAPAKVLRQVECAAQALAISIRAGNHKLAYVGQCIGKSEGYVSRMATGRRPIPRKLIQPLCVATGSLLLQQFHDLEDAMNGVDEVSRLADLLREAA